ncbi:transmembrane protein 179B-like isoform X1 [Lytechinus variegatus]|uniref:transmembrane protein 179B-like isoform X1 n=1 Tax=Lytechinus variegatus TaxID=7654 RepID=UPI001BB1255C|nr:transmembrane protein 179B-like isoform X1 [Lytechinus variegatus]
MSNSRSMLRIGRSLLEILLLLTAAVSGIVVTACVLLTTNDFKGKCLLYSYVSDVRVGEDPKYIVRWTGLANCRFITIVQVAAVIFAIINIGIQGYYIIKSKTHGTSKIPLLFTGLYTVTWTLILVSSCILSVGFSEYCGSWLKAFEEAGEPFLDHCKYVQKVQWHDGLKGDRFYSVLTTAQTAAWISFGVWMLLPLVAWAGVRFVTNRRHPDQASDVPT